MTLESLARTIAKARHGTDAMWANYMGAAREARREVMEDAARLAIAYGDAHAAQDNGEREGYWLKAAADDISNALLAQPCGAQEGGE